jgi:hypothetical protein
VRVAASATSAGAGSTVLPIGSLYAPAGNGLILREVGVFNTTATAPTVGMKLARLTTTGTQGTGLTEVEFSDPAFAPPILGTAFQTHSAGPTIAGDLAVLGVGAAIGSGTILTFYGENNGIYIPTGTGNGVGIVPLGTGQVCTFYFIWDE